MARRRRLFQVVDAHAGGEPARVVVGGLPKIPGVTMKEKREAMARDFDDIRLLMLREPRGFPAQNVNFLFESTVADHGFVIAEQGGVYPGMSGHNCMCVATVVVETGVVISNDEVVKFTLEAPAGIIDVEAKVDEAGRVVSVSLTLGAAHVFKLDHEVTLPKEVLSYRIKVDLAYGSGMTYASVDAEAVGLSPLDPNRGREIVRLGEMIKCAARETADWRHPVTHEPGPEILVFREKPTREGNVLRAKNTVVMSNGGACDWARPDTFTGMLDRSPCGTGTCATMAILHRRGLLQKGDIFLHESIVGTIFQGEIEPLQEEVRPKLTGRAWITAHATIVVDPTDPFPTGLPEVRDIW